ncbi:hypothetical protein PCI56_00850 [Plesiomonas shigelloides subsp. oncorhynchi]|nr:hypothetical protein [Plesiomonas shigelloides]
MYQDEVKTGIGDVDPKTGKTIKNKELANVHVTPDGAGVVLGVKVTYDDGSSTVRPVTEGRSAREDDQPKVIPLMDFVGSGYKRSALAKEFSQNAEQLRVSLGLTPGADVKGYRKAVADLRADTQARLYKIETDPNITDASERERLMEAERMREKTGISELGGVYGISQPKPAAASDNGSESPLSSWVSGDQQKSSLSKSRQRMGSQFLMTLAPPSWISCIRIGWLSNRHPIRPALFVGMAIRLQVVRSHKASARQNKRCLV